MLCEADCGRLREGSCAESHPVHSRTNEGDAVKVSSLNVGIRSVERRLLNDRATALLRPQC